MKLDPSGGLLRAFVELNNRVLSGFSDAEQQRIGVHTCPGGDRDSTHSADVDYTGLLPALFQSTVGRFYIQMASEADRKRVLKTIGGLMQSGQVVFVGVTDPINPKVETAEEVRDRVMEAAKFIPLESLGTTDDCGFSPFADDTSTSRETAFAKIRARIEVLGWPSVFHLVKKKGHQLLSSLFGYTRLLFRGERVLKFLKNK